LEAVTAEDVLRVANEYMRTDNVTITVVGKAQDIASTLSAFGNVEYFDNNGQPTDAPTFLFTPEGVTLETVLNGYFEALGGLDKLKSLKAIDQQASIAIPGMPGNLSMRTAKITPNKFLMEQSMQGMTVMKMVYKDGKGERSGMQGSGAVEGEELDELKNQASFVVDELAWLDDLDQFVFDGQTLIDGKDVYQVSKEDKTYYFDVATGLFYKSTETQETPQGEMAVTTTVREWQEIDGVKFQKVVEQSAGPQAFTITVEKIELNENVKEGLFK
jgi:zinc protease